MTEPPPAWAAPGEEPDDQGRRGFPADPTGPAPTSTPPSAAPPPAAPPPAPGWGAPPPYGQQPSGWGAPPNQPTQWDGQPSHWGGQPSQWGGQPGQWGRQPGQWGGSANQWASGPHPGNRPGIVPLRPLAIGEIYDGAIRAIRSNPRTMVGFSAVVISILTLLATLPQAYAVAQMLNSRLLDPATADSAELADAVDLIQASGITIAVAVLQFVVATTIVSGLLIVAVDGAVRGEAMTPGRLWTRCRSRLLAVLGLAVAVPLAMVLVAAVVLLPGVVLIFLPISNVPGVIALVVGVLVAALASWALYFGFWAVAAPALLLENLGVFAALRRSYRLVRGSFWRVFGISVLTAIIAGIIRQIFSLPFSIVGTLVASTQDSGSFTASLIQLLIGDIGTVLAGAVLFPFTAGVSALLYLDLRMRKEGLDVELMRS